MMTRAWRQMGAMTVAGVIGMTGFGCKSAAPDWQAWRGPKGDGVCTETGLNPAALKPKPTVAWWKVVGDGHAAVAIAGNRLFTMGNTKNVDTVFCLDVNSGKELWRYDYPAAAGNFAGPRATPVVAGDRVFAVSRHGDVFAFAAATGKIAWKRNLVQDFAVKLPNWGISAAPLVIGNNLLLNAGGHGVCLNTDTGATVWGSDGMGGYAVPVRLTYHGRDCAAIFGFQVLNVVDLADGAVRCSFPWVPKCDVNAADPVVAGDKIFISSGYDKGCCLLDLSGAQPKVLWSNTVLRSHFSSPMLVDGCLYGVDGDANGGGAFVCLDFATGKELWRASIEFGSFVMADGHFLYLNETGSLYVIKPDAKKLQIVAEAKGLLDPLCWTTPVFCRGHVFCRNDKGALLSIKIQ